MFPFCAAALCYNLCRFRLAGPARAARAVRRPEGRERAAPGEGYLSARRRAPVGLPVALLYGALQGLTEFLPVSSSGHLALLGRLLHAPAGFGLAVAAHVGTLVAVVVFYRRAIAQVFAGPPAERRARGLVFLAALAATAPLALGLADRAEAAFDQPLLVALGFLLTSLLLLLVARLPRAGRSAPSALDGLLIGAAQGVAVWPGLSRSGATIATARLLGIAPEAAAEFTFLLSIPTVLAALARELLDGGASGAVSWDALAAAAAAALVGFLALRWLVRLLRAGRFSWFALYTLVLAGVGVWLG